MPIINTLREKMGRLVVVVVGVSIMAFVLTDLLGPQSSILGNNTREVGEIAGESVSQVEYANLVEVFKQNFINQYRTNPNEFIMQNIRDQAWEQLIFDIAYTQGFDALDIRVGNDERVDMVQGRNISPLVRQSIVNPQTGQFDVSYVQQVLQSIELDPQSRMQWIQFEQQVVSNRLREKFENLLLKTNYITLAEAQREYSSQVASIEVNYLYIPYFSVNDSLAPVNEKELQQYIDDHEFEYQVEESRSIDYVSFPVIPSSEDTATYNTELANIKAQLELSADDSTYAVSITEQGIGFTTYDPTALPVDLADNISSLNVGDIIGPKLTNGIYTLHKLSGIEESESEFVRVSHILLKTEGKSLSEKSQLRSKANDLLKQARNGADFEALARQNSEDASGPSGGDLGWYKKGSNWTKPFEDAAFSTRRKGLINRLVETEFGYHIMKVTEAPTKNRYKVATIIIEMTSSFETKNEVYQKVGDFLFNVDSYNDFGRYASENGYAVFSGNNIGPNSNNIGRINNARQIITWLYGEAALEDIKDFEMEDEYIVAVYRNKVAKGTATLGNVREEITLKVHNLKKAGYIRSKIKESSGTLNDIATAYGTDANVYSGTTLRINDYSLPNVGNAPEAIGAAFALSKPDDRTSPIITDTGIVMIELRSKTDAPEIADYTTYQTQLNQRIIASDRSNIAQSIKEKANIKDERYKFY